MGSLLLGASVLADEINLSDYKGRRGICVIPDCGDGKLALALAQSSEMIVYALDEDAGNVAKIRRQAEQAGLLGTRLYVEAGTPDKLPMADNLVDLVLMPESKPDENSQTDIFRVLSPVIGKALIGRKTLIKQALPGADDWTHRLHGPDNNPVSTDTAFHAPVMLQYLEMPWLTSYQGTMLAAGGRRIELSDWVVKNPDRKMVAGKMLARNLYNGQILWTRDLPQNMEPDQPLCAVDGEKIYLAADDACRILVISAENGKDLSAITLSDENNLRVKWLAVNNGRLYALIGAALPVRQPFSFMMLSANRETRLKQAVAGDLILVWNLKEQRETWRHKEPFPIDYRTIAVHAGRIYFYSESPRLACLDEQGRLVWENRQMDKMVRPPQIANPNYESTSTLIVSGAGQLRLSLPGAQNGTIFNTEDGRWLWDNRVRGPKSFFVGDQYHTAQKTYEAQSGKEAGVSDVEGGGCGIVTWVPGLSSGVGHVSFGLKSPCGVGAFAASGVLMISPSQCDCWPHLRGAAGFMTAEKAPNEHPLETGAVAKPVLKIQDNDWPVYRGDNRRTGSSGISAGGIAVLKWTTPPVQKFPVPELYNQQRMEWLDRPTPPVTAGGLAFYGASDGSVRTVRIADGKPVWTFWTGGAVLTAPTIVDGRAYIGSADGWVYCLDATTGGLVWRWRGAPMDRRIMVYGKLMSRWPVTALLVQSGVVYGTAGQWMQNGVETFALDAATGREKWRHWTDPEYDALMNLQRDDPGFSPAGQIILVGSNLWIRTYMGLPAIFNADTGKRVSVAADLMASQKKQHWNFGVRFSTSGQDFMVVDDRFVLQGGAPLMDNPDMRQDKSAAKFVGLHVDEKGDVPGNGNPTWGIPGSQIAPALRDGDLLMVGGSGKTHRSEKATAGLSLWSVPEWRAHIERMASSGAVDDADAADPAASKNKETRSGERSGVVTTLDFARATWRHAEVEVNAVVLCDDAAVAVIGMLNAKGKVKYGEHPGFFGWKLAAFDRKTGKERWSVPLPGEPVFNGLAPSASGDWLVVLRDGSLVCAGGGSS